LNEAWKRLEVASVAKAKGTVIIGLVKALRTHKEKAAAALPAALQHYLSERIVVASWYPLEDYIALLRACGKVLQGEAGASVYDMMGRTAARDHMNGTYSRLKNTVSRQAAFTLLTSMYDTGEMKVLERAPGHALLEWVGFALPAREVCETFTGYQSERMGAQGFEDVQVRHVRCRAEGSPSCRWDISWKGRAML
jgi:hypothetical protein